MVSPEHLEEEGELTAEAGVDRFAQEEGGTGRQQGGEALARLRHHRGTVRVHAHP